MALTKIFTGFLIISIKCLLVYSQMLEPENNLEILQHGQNQGGCTIPLNYRQGFRDVLSEICQHLPLSQLRRCEEVCRDFWHAVKHSLKIAGPAILVVSIRKFVDPRMLGHPINHPISQSLNENIRDRINMQPTLALFFYKAAHMPFFYNSIHYELTSHYIHELPKTASSLQIGGSGTSLDYEAISPGANKALGLFLPNREDNVQIRYYVPSAGEESSLKSMMRQFITTDIEELKNNPFVVMILTSFEGQDEVDGYSPINKREIFINELKNTYRKYPQSFSLWGGSVQELGSWRIKSDQDGLEWLAIRISGPGIKSWSIPIDFTKSLDEIHSQLSAFRQKIQIQSKKTVALGMASSTWGESFDDKRQRIEQFKRVFPNVQLMLITQKLPSQYTGYCVDSTNERSEQRLEFNEHFVCYLIISYH